MSATDNELCELLQKKGNMKNKSESGKEKRGKRAERGEREGEVREKRAWKIQK